METKNILKNLKLHESTVSTIFGFLVIIVVGLMVVNYFKNSDRGETFPEGVTTENQNELASNSHIVKDGDSLWTIAEETYGDGFKWTEIAKANNISDPNDIKTGQELTLPDIDKVTELAEASPKLEDVNSTVEPSTKEVLAQENTQTIESPDVENKIAGEAYTVQKGDNLWKIAEAAYGDGYKWTEIATANKLDNPNIIHTGNVFTLPR